MAKGLRTAAFAVASLLLLQAALANPGKGNGKGPPDGRGVGGGSGLANGHGHANEAAINKDVPGLIDGCLAPDYDGIKAFFGIEYAEKQVAKGLLKKPDRDEPSTRGTTGIESWLWRDNVGSDGVIQIPYVFAEGHEFPADQVATINNAFAALGDSVGILNFRPKQASDPKWISVQGTANSGCWSYIGQSSLASGGQPLNLQPNVNGWGCVWTGTIQHEMMHALGFYHEQSRPDRDDYVTILFDNITPGKEHNFEKSSNINSMGSTYDYGSVMHYGRTAFAKESGLTTIDSHGNSIGQRNGASASDVEQIRLLYQCSFGVRGLASYLAEPCTADCNRCADSISHAGPDPSAYSSANSRSYNRGSYPGPHSGANPCPNSSADPYTDSRSYNLGPHSGANARTHFGANDRCANPGSNSGANPGSHSGANPRPNSAADSCTDSRSDNCGSYPGSHSGANPCPNSSADSCTDSRSYNRGSYPCTHSGANACPNSSADTFAHPRLWPAIRILHSEERLLLQQVQQEAWLHELGTCFLDVRLAA
eukprot:jgi/Tetstr1/432082/TSEL_021553.t1